MQKFKYNTFEVGFNFNDLIFFFKKIFDGKSYMRSCHYLFLKNKISLKGSTADLGSGKKNDYIDLLIENKKNSFEFDFYKNSKKSKKINLEKNFDLKKQYKNLLLFNVIEHIYNYKKLISSISKSLPKNGRLELFVPFMYRYHEDPLDYSRFTAFHLLKILKEKNFKVQITLIGVGQISVVTEVILKYLKFIFLKMIFLFLALFFNKVFKYLSKDYTSFYCGIHCSCIKK